MGLLSVRRHICITDLANYKRKALSYKHSMELSWLRSARQEQPGISKHNSSVVGSSQCSGLAKGP